MQRIDKKMKSIITRFYRRGFTVLEMLIAVSVFSALIIGIFGLLSTFNSTFSVGSFKAEAQRQLVTGLTVIREDIEKATYPSAIFANGTVLYGNTPPAAFAEKKPSNDKTNGGIQGLDNFYLRYRSGITNTAPAQGATLDLINFNICTPMYNQNDVIMQKSDVATFAPAGQTPVRLIWRGPTATTPYPVVVYKVGATGQERVFLTHVSSVEITKQDVYPPRPPNAVDDFNADQFFGKLYSIYDIHAVLYIKFELSALTDSRIRRSSGWAPDKLKVVEGTKARCQVRAIPF